MSKDSDWDIVIRSKRPLFYLGLTEIVRYRDLLLLLVKRDIIAFYKQTVLGPLWFFIQPLFTMLVYVFIFTELAGLSTGDLPPSLFYLVGITFWSYFSSTLLKTSNILRSNVNIFGKVYFPRIIMPLSVIFSNLFRLGIQFLLLVVTTLYFIYVRGYTWEPSMNLFLFPFIILLMALQALGIGMIVSALTTKYRDFSLFIGFGLQLFMYATPVVYTMDSIPKTFVAIVKVNPVSYLFEGLRKSLFNTGEFDLNYLLISLLATAIIISFGVIVFNKVERDFVDTI